jgi:hypothetical protein
MIQAFLPVLLGLEYATAAEVYSSILQPSTQTLLESFEIVVVLAPPPCHLSRAHKGGSMKGLSPECRENTGALSSNTFQSSLMSGV